MNNGNPLRAQILDASGQRAIFSTMEPPSGQGPYFGWLGVDGLATVRIDVIQAMCADKNNPGGYLLILKYGSGMAIPAEDAKRLMHRMGWSSRKSIERGAQ